MNERNEPKYPIIYADPPWHYNNYAGSTHEESRHIANHYETMSLPEVAALPVRRLAAKDAALFLWATSPLLPEAFKVMEAWGFKYTTIAFVWVKARKPGKWLDAYPSPRSLLEAFSGGAGLHKGLGYTTRSNAEIVLLGKKGKSLPRLDKSVPQVIFEPIDKAYPTRKPQEVRDRIARLYGTELPRVELFATKAVDGWDIWGSEVPNDIEIAQKGATLTYYSVEIASQALPDPAPEPSEDAAALSVPTASPVDPTDEDEWGEAINASGGQ